MRICSLETQGRSSILICVIAENKEKYISFNIDVIVGLCEDMWGKIKKRKFSLDLSTALGLWLVAWTCSIGIWLG